MTTNLKIGIVAGAIALTLIVVALFTATASSSGAVSAVAATFSALAAVTTASVSASALLQVRKDSRSTTRPQVAAWMRRGGAHGYIDFVVKNFGESIAHDVRIVIEGLPEWAAVDAVLSALWNRYRQPIPTLVPDLELSNTYAGLPEHPENPPDQVTVRISYTDDAGRPYADTFDLDADLIRGETWSQPKS